MQKALNHSNFMDGVKRRNPGEPEFHQAVSEVARDLIPFVKTRPEYEDAQILERLTEPDRIISFRVAWQDDQCNTRVNRGFRVQFNDAIGPYKGGLRFHRDLNLSVLKFLGFEQIFKNSLTGLALGAAKGGANFNPRGKSDNEIMRFCQAFMIELYRYIGPDIDIPAGDLNVGNREIAFLFGQYKRLTHRFNGALTGKSLSLGGSHLRPEATGYGCAYFMKHMLNHRNDSLDGKTCAVSGAGNVALHCAEKLIDLGARVISLSDSNGTLYVKNGLDRESLDLIKAAKLNRKKPLSALADELKLQYQAGQKPWALPCDLAFPCATENELDGQDAKALVDNGCQAIAEGANMPLTADAQEIIEQARLLYAPGKAANAGGVAVSSLEMSQNTTGLYWSVEEVEHRLEAIMEHIHLECLCQGDGKNYVDYARGANIAAFIKVADAMLAYGVV